uniref:Uncharacterized protein n=1 Tax=Arundo donax TaxID=35708 RepID=A0A0A9AD29_ARUDO
MHVLFPETFHVSNTTICIFWSIRYIIIIKSHNSVP